MYSPITKQKEHPNFVEVKGHKYLSFFHFPKIRAGKSVKQVNKIELPDPRIPKIKQLQIWMKLGVNIVSDGVCRYHSAIPFHHSSPDSDCRLPFVLICALM